MMDVSSPMVRLRAAPLSPWLRLAHLSRLGPEQASHTAAVRVLLDFEYVLQTRERSWIWCEAQGGSVEVPCGSVAFLPPGFWHGWGHEAGEHVAVHFDLQAQPRLVALDNIRSASRVVRPKPLAQVPVFALSFGPSPADRLSVPLITRVQQPSLWRERFERLIAIYRAGRQRLLSSQLEAAAILTWALSTLVGEATAAQSTVGDVRILELLRELDDPAATLNGSRAAVGDLARRAGLGLTAFRNAFHATTGQAPRGYLERRRIERAARNLIETEQRVLEIARSEGFEDPYHFSRVFKRVTGLSPQHYRQARRRGSGPPPT